MGAEAIQDLMTDLDINDEANNLREEIPTTNQ